MRLILIYHIIVAILAAIVIINIDFFEQKALQYNGIAGIASIFGFILSYVILGFSISHSYRRRQEDKCQIFNRNRRHWRQIFFQAVSVYAMDYSDRRRANLLFLLNVSLINYTFFFTVIESLDLYLPPISA